MDQGIFWSRDDYRDILGLLYSSRQCISLESMQEKLLKALLSKFGAESGTFYVTDVTSPTIRPADVVTVKISSRAVDEYCDYYCKVDPFFGVVRRTAAYRDNDLMPHSDWEHLEIFKDFRAPQQIYHEMDVYISEGNTLGVISLHRSKERKSFSNKELRKARIFARYFAMPLRQCHIVDTLKERENLLHKVVELCPLGIMILDQNLDPVYWNSNLLKMCSRSTNECQDANSVTSYRGTVSARIVGNYLRHYLALEKSMPAKGEDVGQCHRMILSKDENQGMKINAKVFIVRFPGEQCPDPIEKLSPSCLIFLEELPETVEGLDATAIREYHLSKRETEVVRCLCDGLSNREIADKLYISPSTVATHLRHIFEKTETGSRSKLISRIQPLKHFYTSVQT